MLKLLPLFVLQTLTFLTHVTANPPTPEHFRFGNRKYQLEEKSILNHQRDRTIPSLWQHANNQIFADQDREAAIWLQKLPRLQPPAAASKKRALLEAQSSDSAAHQGAHRLFKRNVRQVALSEVPSRDPVARDSILWSRDLTQLSRDPIVQSHDFMGQSRDFNGQLVDSVARQGAHRVFKRSYRQVAPRSARRSGVTPYTCFRCFDYKAGLADLGRSITDPRLLAKHYGMFAKTGNIDFLGKIRQDPWGRIDDSDFGKNIHFPLEDEIRPGEKEAAINRMMNMLKMAINNALWSATNKD